MKGDHRAVPTERPGLGSNGGPGRPRDPTSACRVCRGRDGRVQQDAPSTPPPPSTGPSPPDTITGNERFGWDQRAADARLSWRRSATRSTVDGTRAELTGAMRATTSTNGTFACSAPLPALTRGAHTLELASFIVDGSTFESPRSPALRITVGITAPGGDQTPTRISAGDAGVPGDPFNVELVINNVDRPRDLAFAPDGRLFVVEATGPIRIVHRDGGVTADVLAGSRRSGDAADATARSPSPSIRSSNGRISSTLSASQPRGRRRDVHGREVPRGERHAGRARGDPWRGSRHDTASAGSLRFGADGKLFVAFDDGADPRRSTIWRRITARFCG